jgi:hypothetical protein
LRKRYKILSLAILSTIIIVVAVFAYVYSQYVPRVLVNDALTLKESHQWQFDLFVLGSRSVNVNVSTVQYPVFVTFWFQQGLSATTYLFDKQVTNTTQASLNVSVQQSGTYHLSVQKTEQYGENVTTVVHVAVIS